MKENKLKIVLASVITLAIISSEGSALAFGLDVSIVSKGDTFTNKGTMEATQLTNAGVAYQTVALRARSLNVDGKLNYSSSNNTYINSGKMTAKQITSAGAAYQVVALEAH